MGGITSVNLTDSGSRYRAIPVVTVSAPTGDSAVAAASTIVFGGRVTDTEIDSGGAYYTSNVTVTCEEPRSIDDLIHYYDGNSGLRKFGTHSYQLGSPTSIDSDLKMFNSEGKTWPQSLEFWIYTSFTRTHDIMKFKTAVDADGSKNKLSLEGDNIRWHYSLSDGVSGSSVATSDFPIQNSAWHFVQLVRKPDGTGIGHYLYVNGVQKDYLQGADSSSVDYFIDGRSNFDSSQGITMMNSSTNVYGTYIDAMRFQVGDSANDSGGYGLTIFAPTVPDSDRDPGNDKNYNGFQEGTRATLTASTSGGKVTAITVNDGGRGYFEDSEPGLSFSNPTGVPATFRAKVGADFDSASGKISGLYIIDSGDFYVAAPTITIADPVKYKDFIIGEDIHQEAFSDGTVLTAEVVTWNDSSSQVGITHVGNNTDGSFHEPTTGMWIVGQSSGAQGYITKSIEQDTVQSQNEEFNTEIEDILDFSETNPFGEPDAEGHIH